ncbi:MAG: 5-(carboxyamino)imidazole ribonucleotide synthase [Alphaproteobacteria bacterium]
MTQPVNSELSPTGSKPKDPLPPGGVIGILGGGQLGQMLALAATRLGFHCHIYTDTERSPAARVAAHTVHGSYDDIDKVRAFASDVDVLTYEFENVPAKTAEATQSVTKLRPGANALETAQDRMTEKTFIRETANVPVTPFHPVNTIFDLRRILQRVELPIVLKTRRMGYDGKGQVIIRDENELEVAFKTLGDVPLIAEEFIAFKREVSVIAARSATGETTSYPLIENVHNNHILHMSTSPTTGDDGRARAMAIQILDALEYVGVLAVEFFECENGDLLVNEIAPRVHNSGHWTQNAGCIDQFELHIRAIAGWPLGDTEPQHAVQMLNLIGEDASMWPQLAKDPKTFIHLYGKKETRKGRKMGHVNRIIG